MLQHALYIVYIAAGVFIAGWIEVSCWILTGERQTAVIRSKYVQVLLNQDMSFFDTYGNNGDIVSQVLSDVLLIQSAISEKVSLKSAPGIMFRRVNPLLESSNDRLCRLGTTYTIWLHLLVVSLLAFSIVGK
jgi:ABC-type multidrug transport system fused ATPase/permease subunit